VSTNSTIRAYMYFIAFLGKGQWNLLKAWLGFYKFIIIKKAPLAGSLKLTNP